MMRYKIHSMQRRLAMVDLWSSRSLNECSHMRNRGAQIEESGIFSVAV